MRSFRTSPNRDILPRWGPLVIRALRLFFRVSGMTRDNRLKGSVVIKWPSPLIWLTGLIYRLLCFHLVRGTPEYFAMIGNVCLKTLVLEIRDGTGDLVAIVVTVDSLKEVLTASQQGARVSEVTPCEGKPEEPA